jgi:carnitine O-acetyltransferase
VLEDSQGRIWNRASLKRALQSCVDQSSQQSQLVPELGWLTATDRDSWSQTYDLLLSSGNSAVEAALHDLQSAQFVLCLDQNNAPLTDTQHAAQLWHGDLVNSANRWMDKTIQITVNTDGDMGYLGEHAMMDGVSRSFV